MFFHTISYVGLKFPRLHNHLKTHQQRKYISDWMFDQVFLYRMVFCVKIWTGIASNNTISWSATDDSILTYFRREHRFVSQIHHVHVSTPRWSMFIFLLKCHGGTPQNICFNVFVILVCFIYGENNIWHVQSWRFTPAVEVVSQTALHHAGSLVVSNFTYLG